MPIAFCKRTYVIELLPLIGASSSLFLKMLQSILSHKQIGQLWERDKYWLNANKELTHLAFQLRTNPDQFFEH